MAAVIRVKRRIFDEPVDSLVINCKRRKTDDTDSETSVSALIKLATTLKNEVLLTNNIIYKFIIIIIFIHVKKKS